MKYRHILLDVGGTLIFPKPSVGAVYASEARLFSVDMDAAEAQKAFVRAWKASKAAWKSPLRYGRTEEEAKSFWREVVYRTFNSRVPEEKKEDLFTHLFHHFAQPEIWDCYTGVHETLNELHGRGHILSILSNWDIRLPLILQGLGLSPYFRHEFISFATGLEKPDPNAFKHCLDKLNAKPNEVLYIGNDHEEDYQPATALGLSCYLLQHGDHWDFTHSAPTLESIRELLTLC